MSCQKRRQGDEEFCPTCNLRWDFGNPPPAGAKCLVGNRKSEAMDDVERIEYEPEPRGPAGSVRATIKSGPGHSGVGLTREEALMRAAEAKDRYDARVAADDPGALTEEQITIRLGLLLVSAESCSYTERQAIVRAMQTAINRDKSEADLYLANNEAIAFFPWLSNIRRRHEGVK